MLSKATRSWELNDMIWQYKFLHRVKQLKFYERVIRYLKLYTCETKTLEPVQMMDTTKMATLRKIIGKYKECIGSIEKTRLDLILW